MRRRFTNESIKWSVASPSSKAVDRQVHVPIRVDSVGACIARKANAAGESGGGGGGLICQCFARDSRSVCIGQQNPARARVSRRVVPVLPFQSSSPHNAQRLSWFEN